MTRYRRPSRYMRHRATSRLPCASVGASRHREQPQPSVQLALAALLVCAAILLAGCGPFGATQPPHTSALTTRHTAAIAATPRTITYVAIGASDAFGVGTDDPATDSWPNVLANKLGDNVHLVNLGIPGELAGQAIQNELPIALDAHPNLVTVWLAVNDLAGDIPLGTYQQQLTSLLASLRQRTDAHIFVANLPDLSALPAFSQYDPAVLRARIQQWNAVIAASAASYGAVLVDLYGFGAEIAAHPEYIAPDGLHPSTLGAIQLAEVFALAIQRAHVI